jgi:hypothetical protein
MNRNQSRLTMSSIVFGIADRQSATRRSGGPARRVRAALRGDGRNRSRNGRLRFLRRFHGLSRWQDRQVAVSLDEGGRTASEARGASSAPVPSGPAR